MKIVSSAIVFFGLTASAMAMTPSDATIVASIKALGFSSEVVSQLSPSELAHIGTILHDGSDSDQRQAVRSAVLKMTLNPASNAAAAFAHDGSDVDQRLMLAAKASAPIAGNLSAFVFDGEDNEQRRFAN